MAWSKVVCPGADSVMSTETVSGRESMLICVPSGAMSWFDWLSSEATPMVAFFLSQFAAEESHRGFGLLAVGWLIRRVG